AADDRVWLRVTRSRSVRCALSSPTPRPWVERGLLASGADLVAAGEASDLRVTVGAEPGSGQGDALTFAPPAAVGPVGLGPALVEPRVVAWDREHPLLAHVELGDLLLGAARGLVLGSSADPLVFARPAAGGEAVPIAAAFRADGGLHVVVGFDPDESSWPRQLSFPIFLRNLVRAAEERLEGSEPSALRAGGPVSVPLQDAEVVTLTLPDGAQRSLPVVDGRAVFDSRQGVGVYRLRTPSAERLVCVNLLDPQESQLAAPPTLDVGARPISVETSSHARREVTWWFALVACGLLCVEVWAYHRRW
ncbi:MAG: hypothetical protein KDD82_21800, partial [Planctomycetes bacterium]|nr:hypothetical protein [Planctomycetota bacterium]